MGLTEVVKVVEPKEYVGTDGTTLKAYVESSGHPCLYSNFGSQDVWFEFASPDQARDLGERLVAISKVWEAMQ